jgi:hypothetical protein
MEFTEYLVLPGPSSFIVWKNSALFSRIFSFLRSVAKTVS